MTIIQKKSQILMEFILLSGLALIVTIIFVESINQNKDLHQTQEFLLVKDVVLKIQNEIGITSFVEDGYSRQFELPDKINYKNYNISIINNTLVVWTNFTSFNTIFTTRILNITGYLKKGLNTITKTNGVTYIN